MLRYLRDGARIWRLARDAGISRATASPPTLRTGGAPSYLHEGLRALAAQAPTLPEAVEAAMADGHMSLCLDGTLVPIDRVDARNSDRRHLHYSGKHRAFGVNVQVIATIAGDVLGVPSACGGGVSPGSPGSVHDTRAARTHVIDDLAPYISRHHRRDATVRLWVLADKGYTGWGHLPLAGDDVGISTPTKRRRGVTPHVDEVIRNQLLIATRAPAERANAQLSVRWRALHRVTPDPAAVSIVVAAALVLTLFKRQHGRN